MLKDPTTYRMTVHPFGGVWSPSCANFALKRTVDNNVDVFDPETLNTVLNNFYVGDCLKSVSTKDKAVQLDQELCQLTSLGGFRLTKWISNDRHVLERIPVSERAKEVQKLELSCGSLPVEKALGVHWNVDSNSLGIQIKNRNDVSTRRNLLSILSSVYDPLGLVCPYILLAKTILQRECKLNKGWDDELDAENKQVWGNWLRNLPMLQNFQLDRGLIPVDFGSCVGVEFHIFCDASEEAYGAVSYIRVINSAGDIYCALFIGKSRLAPIQQMLISRLELSAAVLAVRVSSILNRELGYDVCRNVFWTDSTIVLQYIRNKTKRFHTFVANRMAVIHDGSSPEQWIYVDTKLNPADDASRGLKASEMVASERWKMGPEFLWKPESTWPEYPESSELLENDKEVRTKAQAFVVTSDSTRDPVNKLLTQFLSWHRLKRAVSAFLKFKKWLRCRAVSKVIDTYDMMYAEHSIMQYLQAQCFWNEFQVLSAQRGISKQSKIYGLESFLGTDDIIRVGGRLLSAPISDAAKHPAILPRDHHVTTLIVRHVHELQTKHSGREHTLAAIRQRFWIPKCRPLINGILKRCVTCKRLHSSLGAKKMTSLPVDHVESSDFPFAMVGIDCFRPFYVKRGRSKEKRYGCLFTCLSMRAIHIERLYTLKADSFIRALIRFIVRRGVPELIRSDNGTNFVGGEKELRTSIQQVSDCSKTQDYLLRQIIKWEFNPPSASHMGGVWERQIRYVRKVLNVVLKDKFLTTSGEKQFSMKLKTL